MQVTPAKGERIQVVLADGEGTRSLVFGEGATHSDLSGDFRLRSVRFAKRHEKHAWMLSTTAPPKARLRLDPTKPRVIKGAPVLDFVGRAQSKPGELFLGFTLACRKRGVTIYRDARRVAIGYRVLDGKGRALRSGRMNYG